MRNHTTPSFYELVSQQGKNPSFTPGTSPVAVQFLMNNLPTGKDGRLWYYVTALIVKISVRINVPSTADDELTADQLWQIVQSVNVQCPILGQLFTHQNTRGATLGNIIQYAGMGFNRAPVSVALAPPTEGSTNFDRVLYFRIPFAYEFLCKPHETSPWTGFLEGGTLEVKVDTSTVLQSVATDVTLTGPASMRAWIEYIPSPETCIHTPTHWREHQTPGNSTKMIIQDMGSPDGLQGIDQSKGVGIAHLLYLMNPDGLGLAGSTTADNILSYDVPWRDQQRVDIPDAPFLAKIVHMGNNRLAPADTATVAFGAGQGGDPYSFAAQVQGNLNDEEAMYFPLVACGRDLETSKLQTVAGAKESNYTFGTDGTPSGINRFLGQYFPVFDEQFMQSLAARIAPTKAGELVAKTLNKQKGGVHGVGKLAYVRAKVK